MQGRVQWYDPGSRRGRLIDQDGQALQFEMASTKADIHGGDVVCFRAGDDNASRAVEVRVVQRCVDYLNNSERALVNQFHSTVAIKA